MTSSSRHQHSISTTSIPDKMDKLAPSTSSTRRRSNSRSSVTHTPNRSLGSRMELYSTGRPSSAVRGMGRTPLRRAPWEGDDSVEIPEPDFAFDWLAADISNDIAAGGGGEGTKRALVPKLSKDELREAGDRLGSLTFSPVTRPASSSARMDSTPPTGAQRSMNMSSASSNRIMALTEASSSTSSLHPSTPNGVGKMGMPNGQLSTPSGRVTSARAQTPGSANGAANGRSGRTFGSRTFQRVVSAPVTRLTPRKEITSAGNQEESVLSNTWGSTTTMRPPMYHTTSGSSIHGDSQNGNTGNQNQRTRYVTPGHTERVLGALGTAGRIRGLSRFGGPPQRAADMPANEEQAEEGLMDDAHSGTDSPVDGQPSDQSRRSPLMNESSPSETDNKSYHLSPTSDAPPERHLSPHPLPSHQSVHSLHGRRNSPDPDVKPFRPFQPEVDKENQPPQQYSAFSRDASKPMARAFSTGSTLVERPQPLRPTHSVERPLSPSRERELVASRPAPVMEHDAKHVTQDVKPLPQMNSIPATLSAQTEPPFQQQLPAQVTVPQKRSFIVNNNAYERVGILGKGGTSKVYSVLCPVKRVVYALKRVALDRADAETYQSYTNEIELLKRLRGHDRIIQLIDHQITFSAANRPKMLMMVMECGEIDFAMLLEEQRGKYLNVNFVGLYWEQMLEAVQAVHRENVVHTDLKPANFVLVKGRLKIIDFGIAKAVANDTVNIQRDQQIGTVNYMSPEAIQRMNNQKVLKLSYPSDVWSLGCILYQMIYGNPPFASIPGGPLPKMNAIADPSHEITFPETVSPKITSSEPLGSITVNPAAVDSMRRCLAYKKEQRLTIEELLHHEFLRPRVGVPALPPNSTTITESQMGMLVDFVLKQNNLPRLSPEDFTPQDLFSQLQAQNALT